MHTEHRLLKAEEISAIAHSIAGRHPSAASALYGLVWAVAWDKEQEFLAHVQKFLVEQIPGPSGPCTCTCTPTN
jgi:hypothetical protein